jgi:hypothetical protein
MRILYMKKKTLFLFFLAFCILFFETASFGKENKTPNLPSVFVPESRFEFAPVLDGTEITHDFIVQNKGTAPLKIEKVGTG